MLFLIYNVSINSMWCKITKIIRTIQIIQS